MKKGEKGILVVIAVFVGIAMLYKAVNIAMETKKDPGIPFYSTATAELQKEANTLMRELNCRDCHVLWAQRTLMQSVPAPSLDGIGSIRSREWLYQYFSAEDPQLILPSRLKAEFKMPSFKTLSTKERELLADYVSSLKVKDWYLDETKKREYEKLTGREYKQ